MLVQAMPYPGFVSPPGISSSIVLQFDATDPGTGTDASFSNVSLLYQPLLQDRPFVFPFVARVGSDVGAQQGVAFDGTHYYVTAGSGGGNEQWTLYKYDTSFNLVDSRDTELDGSGTHHQLAGIYYNASDSKLYICANDFDSAEGDPQTSPNGWVYIYNASDLSFDTYHSLGSKISEQVVKWGGYWWEVNWGAHEVRQFDTSFTLVDSHSLDGPDPGSGRWQALVVINNVFYLNPHETTGPKAMQAYTWNGSGFDFIATSFAPPTGACTQGAYFDGSHVYWAERESLTKGNVVKSDPPQEG
jgi:hypothetical protein